MGIPCIVPFDYADGNGLMLVVERSRNRDRPLDVPFDYGDGNGDRSPVRRCPPHKIYNLNVCALFTLKMV
ncbi:hypothetical protein NWP22_12180 [Anabaenopsis tanganyikae CS-531]|uniref:Uncharacterized protein n=1 Tax=Anabaenopsis tanganyikae CS-531 TaxID=2785304 RepID=A0ABT6KFF9_9CYAN|nr:hypothetical protein [Anabaenopsis tanganyikae]MDH6106617.1 hypothetical protein [Anabaenopsis tanganyikae CS-531]